MKPGDMVRFAFFKEALNYKDWSNTEKKHLGLLVEHDSVQGNVMILHNGEIIKIRANLAEKAGKKDYEKR